MPTQKQIHVLAAIRKNATLIMQNEPAINTTENKTAGKDARMFTAIFAVVLVLFLFSKDAISNYLRGFFIGQTILSLIAARIGMERKIGFVAAFIISFYLTPRVGFIFAFNSRRILDEEYQLKMVDQLSTPAQAHSVAE